MRRISTFPLPRSGSGRGSRPFVTGHPSCNVGVPSARGLLCPKFEDAYLGKYERRPHHIFHSIVKGSDGIRGFGPVSPPCIEGYQSVLIVTSSNVEQTYLCIIQHHQAHQTHRSPPSYPSKWKNRPRRRQNANFDIGRYGLGIGDSGTP